MLGELEDAILARIRLFNEQPGAPYRLRTIESYGGQLDEDTQETYQSPAIFVVLAGMQTLARVSERTSRDKLDVDIYCVAYNNRNERSRRQGDKTEVGSYQLAEDVRALLENQKLGQPIKPLRFSSLRPEFVARKQDGQQARSILRLSFSTEVVIEAALPDCIHPTPDMLAGISSGFYVRPGGEVPFAQTQVDLT